jgi:hypothetical protein
MNRTIERFIDKTRGKGMKKVLEKAETKTFNTPDEVRTFPDGKLELVKIGGVTIGRATFEPGWRWSTYLRNMPIPAFYALTEIWPP